MLRFSWFLEYRVELNVFGLLFEGTKYGKNHVMC